jgi:hypothetical protein
MPKAVHIVVYKFFGLLVFLSGPKGVSSGLVQANFIIFSYEPIGHGNAFNRMVIGV